MDKVANCTSEVMGTLWTALLQTEKASQLKGQIYTEPTRTKEPCLQVFNTNFQNWLPQPREAKVSNYLITERYINTQRTIHSRAQSSFIFAHALVVLAGLCSWDSINDMKLQKHAVHTSELTFCTFSKPTCARGNDVHEFL
eukprot:2662637-Amphidinium_carterae.1